MKGGSDVEEGCGISVSAGSSGPSLGSAGGGAAEARAAAALGAAAGGSAHYWEDDIFRGEEPGKAVRRGLSFAGLPMGTGGREQQPLLLAGVRGTDHRGQPFRWVARRQRKCVSHYHECATPPPAIDWLGSLDAVRLWRKPGWLVAAFFTIGSILFVISGIAGLVTAIGNPSNPTPGGASVPAGLIGWPNAIAANLLFFPAGLIQLAEAVNMDLPKRRRAWEADGRRGGRPGLRLLPNRHDLRTVSFWVVAIQLAGMLGFNMATVANLVGYMTHIKESASTWLINFGFTFGGTGFTVSSLLGCWEERQLAARASRCQACWAAGRPREAGGEGWPQLAGPTCAPSAGTWHSGTCTDPLVSSSEAPPPTPLVSAGRSSSGSAGTATWVAQSGSCWAHLQRCWSRATPATREGGQCAALMPPCHTAVWFLLDHKLHCYIQGNVPPPVMAA